MEPDEIRRILEERVREAHLRRDKASERFCEAQRNPTVGGLQTAAKDYAEALRELLLAMQAQNRFILLGDIPSDLRSKAPKSDAKGRIAKSGASAPSGDE